MSPRRKLWPERVAGRDGMGRRERAKAARVPNWALTACGSTHDFRPQILVNSRLDSTSDHTTTACPLILGPVFRLLHFPRGLRLSAACIHNPLRSLISGCISSYQTSIMGQTLSSPATAKTTDHGSNSKFHYAVSEMQGWRISMEDAHTIALELDEGTDEPNTFFAVYDGHGGGAVAKYAGENVHKRLLSDEAYQKREYPAALKNAFLGTDADMRSNPAFTRDMSGCTAVAALVTHEGKIYVANAGDSRSVISVKGEVKPLSYDHKPQNETEKSRVVAAGGYIEFGRVNGNLALARALGDFDYKKNTSLSPEAQIITCNPDIIEHQITEDDEFLIIACDGIWDCLTSQQVVNVVRLLVSQGKRLPEVCEELCELCLAPDTNSGAGIGCDNMTVLVVALLHGRTVDQWYDWVTDRVKNKYGYDTPDKIPELYFMSYKARKEAFEARARARESQRTPGNSNGNSVSSGGFGGFARVLGSNGGISFGPGSGILSGGSLMFDNDDSDDDDSGDEELNAEGSNARSFFSDAFGYPQVDQPDVTKSLRDQLDELERGVDYESDDMDGDVPMGDIDDEETVNGDAEPLTKKDLPQSSHELQGEAPPPPIPVMNGDSKIEQFESVPGPDVPSAVVMAEGLMDSSDSPLKV
ncbi:PP2C-domain-containing protein [Amylocystis lapponica]|nr:PP2C-domain-containing protein [Amylocystis lapponica]